MARIRTIKPNFFLSEDVAALPYQWRLLFVGLWTQADREGRLEDRPLRLKASLFPYDSLDVEDGLTALHRAGLITRYEVQDRRLIAIPTWRKHQQPHIRESASELPEPGARPVQAPVQPVGREGKGREQEGKEGSPEPLRDSTPTASVSVLEFPVVGFGGPVWSLSEAQVSEWSGAYPGLAILAEAQKALAWVKASPGRRKTAGGMARFLVGWLNRANDSRPTTAPKRPIGQAPAAGQWVCPHLERCASPEWCQIKNNQPEKYPLRETVAS